MKYRRKTVEYDVYRWDGDFTSEYPEWMNEALADESILDRGDHLIVNTFDNGSVVLPGDYILRDPFSKLSTTTELGLNSDYVQVTDDQCLDVKTLKRMLLALPDNAITNVTGVEGTCGSVGFYVKWEPQVRKKLNLDDIIGG